MNWPGNARLNNTKGRSFTFFQITKPILLTFCVSMLSTGAHGANKSVPIVDEKQIVFGRLPPEMWLTQSPATAIAQNGAGSIRFRTPSGLNRFDGYKERKYLKSDAADSIAHDSVRSVLVDSSDLLWVGTGGGFSVYDPGTQRFRYRELLQGNELDVDVIYQSQSGEVLVGTSPGISSVKTGADLFRVRGANTDGVWNEDGLGIPMTINTPFWATWWAYCVYVALALFSLYQLLIVRSKKMDRQAEDRFNRRMRGYVESLDNTAECVLNANQQGNVMFSNNAVSGVLGRRPSEVGGYPLFEMLFQQAELRHEAKEYVDNGNNFWREVPYLMSDGTAKVLEISVSPALETSEEYLAYVSIVRDVTERSREQVALRNSHNLVTEELNNLRDKLESSLVENADQRTDFSAALAEKDLLLREIHDRVYDNLEMLTSMLSIQSDKYADPAILNILGENERRIRSIALVHERLYQSKEVRKVSMGEYVDVLLSTLYRKLVSEELDINLVKELGEFDLTIDLAVPCGLIINELFSNALIHGTEPGQQGSGTVEVKLYLLAKECVVFVSDSGRGLPIKVNTEAGSMGLEIVSILVEQLEGSFRLIGGEGTTFEVRFPVLLDGTVG